MTRAIPIVAAMTVALAGCVAAEDASSTAGAATAQENLAQEGEHCFFPGNVTGFRSAPDGPGGAQRIYVDVGAKDSYLFETYGGCHNLSFAHGVVFDQVSVGRICRGADVDLIVPDRTLGPQRCQVRMIQKVLPDAN